MFKRVGILGHPLRPETGEVCSRVALSIKARGVDAWCCPVWDTASVAPLIGETDLVIAIGGDGSMLRAARVCSMADVPVFGINAGHLGFLTETSLLDWDDAVTLLLAGSYWVEARMMLRCEAWRNGTPLAGEHALNDVVISRGVEAKSILLETYIDGGFTTDYNADGLIIATPTGSTAYALAVGGPILPPELKNILVVPVAPHLTLDRPMVLSEGAVVEVILASRPGTDAVLSVDGENIAHLLPGDAVIVTASDHISRFVRLRERNYFYRSILDRLEPRVPSWRTREHRRTRTSAVK